MQTEIKINVPEGYEIDQENSTFECIKFKPKSITYNDIAKKLFSNKEVYIPFESLPDTPYTFRLNNRDYYSSELCSTEKQAKKLLALNKLINVAKYLNGDWKPDFNEYSQLKYYIFIYMGKPQICQISNANYGTQYFKSEELAKQAIEILGEETIKLALSQV